MEKFVLNDSQVRIVTMLLDNEEPLMISDIQDSTHLSK